MKYNLLSLNALTQYFISCKRLSNVFLLAFIQAEILKKKILMMTIDDSRHCFSCVAQKKFC